MRISEPVILNFFKLNKEDFKKEPFVLQYKRFFISMTFQQFQKLRTSLKYQSFIFKNNKFNSYLLIEVINYFD